MSKFKIALIQLVLAFGFNLKAAQQQIYSDSVDGEIWTYSISNGYACIECDIGASSAYLGKKTDVTIPTKLGGLEVKYIAPSAFGYKTISSLVIPEGVERVGSYAVRSSSLESLSLPATLKYIGERAFNSGYQSWIRGVSITGVSDLVIEDKAFYEMPLSSIVIEGTNISIGAEAFYHSDWVSMGAQDHGTISLTGSGIVVAPRAFYGMKYGFMNVDLSGVVEIGEDAFNSLGLNRIYAYSDSARDGGHGPGKVTVSGILGKVHPQAMYRAALGDVFFDSLESVFESPGWCSLTAGRNTWYSCLMSCGGKYIYELAIPSTVTEIPDYAWGSCKLYSLEIPLSVTNVGAYAFANCGLTNVVVSDVEKITFNDGCFAGNKIEAFTLPARMRRIPDEMFKDCGKLAKCAIPAGVEEIGPNAFYGCSLLEEVALPSSLTNVGSSAFCVCSGITNVSISSVGSYASIDFGNEWASPFSYLAKFCPNGNLVNEVVIPEGTTRIGSFAFARCANLTKVTIPSTVTEIGKGAFYGCSALIEVEGGENVVNIGDSAFYKCAALNEFTFSNGLKKIGDLAFWGCSSFSFDALPDTIELIGAKAFEGTKVVADADKGLLIINGNWIATVGGEVPSIIDFNALGIKRMVKHSLRVNNDFALVWSKDAGSVPDEAFEDVTKLTDVVIPDGVDEVGDSAFHGCSGLKKLYVGAKLLGEGAFSGCYSLTNVTVTKSVRTIKSEAFSGNRVSVLTIEDISAWVDAEFEGLNSIPAYDGGYLKLFDSEGIECTELMIPSGVERIAPYAFAKMHLKCPVRFEEGLKEIGKYAFYQGGSSSWFTPYINSFPDSLERIGENAFYGVSAHDVKLPEGFRECGFAAFAHSGVRDVYIPSSMKAVPGECFYNCLGLTNVIISEGVEVIEGSAFTGLNSEIKSICFPRSIRSLGGNIFGRDVKDVVFCGDEPDASPYVFSSAGSDMVAYVRRGSSWDKYNLPILWCGKPLRYIDSATPNPMPNQVFSTNIVVTASTGPGHSLRYTLDGSLPTEQSLAWPSAGVQLTDTTTIRFAVVNDASGTVVQRYSYTYDFAPFVCSKVWGIMTIVSARGSLSGDLVIPAELNGVPITAIAENAFYDCQGLTSVTIPASITSVGSCAFAYCNNLTNAVLSLSMSTIPSGMFEYAGLKSVVIPGSVEKIEKGAFRGCANLDNVALEEGIKTIERGAFVGTRMRQLVVPSTITSFSLASVVENLQGVESENQDLIWVGSGWSDYDSHFLPSLEKIIFVGECPAKLETWAVYEWNGNPTIKYPFIFVQSANKASSDAKFTYRFFDYNGTQMQKAIPYEIYALTTKERGDGTLEISKYNGSYLGIPETFKGRRVTSIGSYAFSDLKDSSYNGRRVATQVQKYNAEYRYYYSETVYEWRPFRLEIPDFIESIGSKAFAGCEGLEVLRLGNHSPEVISKDALYGLDARIVVDVDNLEWGETWNGYLVDHANRLEDFEVVEFEDVPWVDAATAWMSGSLGEIESSTMGIKISGPGKLRFGWVDRDYCLTIKLDGTVIKADWEGQDGEPGRFEKDFSNVGNHVITFSYENWYMDDDQLGYAAIFDFSWTPRDAFNIRFNANGGVGTVTVPVKIGDALVFPEVTRNGYEFLGWYTKSSGGEKVGNGTIPTEDCEYYAHWKIEEYSITYVGAKGVANPNPTSYTVAQNIAFESISDIPNWHFISWEPSGIKSGSTGDVVVVANWEGLSPQEYVNCVDAETTTGGDLPWCCKFETGSWTLRSGELNGAGESWLELRVANPCSVSFDWRASCEGSFIDSEDEEHFFDYLGFFVDGELIDAIAGETEWDNRVFEIPGAGEHKLRWAYIKDETDSEGEDCGWVANIEITPMVELKYVKAGQEIGLPPDSEFSYPGSVVKLPGCGTLAWPKHRFVGWSDGSTTYLPGVEFLVGTAGNELTAVWEEKHLAKPVISAPTGFAAKSAVVTITATAGCEVYYTLNGVEPSLVSTKYEGPFEVSSSCVIKAIAIANDWYDSEIAVAEATKASYQVTFDAGEFGEITEGAASQIVEHGDSAVPPKVTADDWHYFASWDGECESVTSDRTLTAVYGLKPWTVDDAEVYHDMGIVSKSASVYFDKSTEDWCAIKVESDGYVEVPVEGYARLTFSAKGNPNGDFGIFVDGVQQEKVEPLAEDWERRGVVTRGYGDHVVRIPGECWLADFEIEPVEVLFFAAAGGETGEPPAPRLLLNGKPFRLPSPGALTYPNHRFIGWSNGERVWGPKDVYDGPSVTATLVAVWEEKHLAEPVIDAPVSFEGGDCEVSITADEGASVYYTTDGSAPSVNSMLYDNPFTITASVTIKAIAICDDFYDSNVAVKTITREPFTFGEYLGLPQNEFVTAGDAEWVKAKGDGIDGGYALKSGVIGDSQSSVLMTSVSGSGKFKFSYRVSSEAKKGIIADGLSLFIDDSGVKSLWDGGDTGWIEKEIVIEGDGEHDLKWVYSKNAQNSSGSDCAWLANMSWLPDTPVVPPGPIDDGISLGSPYRFAHKTGIMRSSEWYDGLPYEDYILHKGHIEGLANADTFVAIPVYGVSAKDAVIPELSYIDASAADFGEVTVVDDKYLFDLIVTPILDKKDEWDKDTYTDFWDHGRTVSMNEYMLADMEKMMSRDFEWDATLWPDDKVVAGRCWILVQMKLPANRLGMAKFKVGLKGKDVLSDECCFLRMAGGDNIDGLTTQGYFDSLCASKWFQLGTGANVGIDGKAQINFDGAPSHSVILPEFKVYNLTHDETFEFKLQIKEAGTLVMTSAQNDELPPNILTIRGDNIISDVWRDRWSEGGFEYDIDWTLPNADEKYLEFQYRYGFANQMRKVEVSAGTTLTFTCEDGGSLGMPSMVFYPKTKKNVNVRAIHWVSSETDLYLRGVTTGSDVYCVGDEVVLRAYSGGGEEFVGWKVLYGSLPTGIDLTKKELRFTVTEDMCGTMEEECQLYVQALWSESPKVGGAIIENVNELQTVFGEHSEVAENITGANQLSLFNGFLADCGVKSAGSITPSQKQYAYQSFKLSEITTAPRLFEEEPVLKIDDIELTGGNLALTISLTAGAEAIQLAKDKLADKIRVGTSVDSIDDLPNITTQPTNDGASLTFVIKRPGSNAGFVKVEIE